MSLNGLLNIGSTALAVNTAAIQVTGNNIANVGNADYTRQVAGQSSAGDTKINGKYVGNGVQLDGIARQINEALEARLRSVGSDNAAASSTQDWLGRMESVFNELSDSDLSTKLSTFYKSWSDLANKPQDTGLRQIVLQDAQSVTDWFHQIDTSLSALQTDLNETVKGQADAADDLTKQIAKLNGQISTSEVGGSGPQANSLRDQRDAMLKKLSQLINVQTVSQPNGSVNVYVGSAPLVVGNKSNGVTTVKDVDASGNTVLLPAFKTDSGVLKLDANSGQLGALVSVNETLAGTTGQVNALAGSLSFELNKLHSSGQGLEGLTTAVGNTVVADPTKSLLSPDAGLKQLPNNGSFVVHVKNKASGLSTSTLVHVNLKGDAGDTTMDSLIASINGVDGVTAVNNGGRLQITADGAPASEITFSQDSSGALAALGVNTFFTGTNARDIDVAAALQKDPNLIAAAQNGDSGDNSTALAIAKLETTDVKSLGGSTMKDSYQDMINGLATKSSQASSDVESTAAVQSTLQNQRDTVSGVSEDEEAVNLMRYQRAYQGAARLVTVVDEMMDTMLNLVR